MLSMKSTVAGAARNLCLVLICVMVVAVIPAHPEDLPGVHVIFFDRNKEELCRFEAELAVTPQQQAQGLMFRTSIRRRTGMLFINDRDDMHHFWMKNTYIPLDLIFINGRYQVVHVHRGARPRDETQISSRYPVRYIFEINAGEAKECSIVPGITAQFGRIGAPR